MMELLLLLAAHKMEQKGKLNECQSPITKVVPKVRKVQPLAQMQRLVLR